jgi:hypothetical protein
MSSNIKIDKKTGPSSSPYNDSGYYQYHLKYPNKEGVLTQYMIETNTSPHTDRVNYAIFVVQENGEYFYINPTAQYQVDSLPFTYDDARRAVETYELKKTLSPSTAKTFEDIIDEL